MAETATLDLNVTLTHREDQSVEVPVTISISYPEGHGIYAVQALKVLDERAEGVIASLADSGDPSILKRLDELGLVLDSDDEEEADG
ncbi:hypothetical protein M3B43_12035 [Nesterenkonia massiliensis]|uniref:Uncharacterized protein n=1 Tax=Nesterenkonia massiliensis TaxID=1232429 RepID=A0ABT2HTJ5_9MICC|nr:hypothetical protein [Nesterenkonia massiliensis]MCT1608027.1 hypothetical protein [Nesterenkonia massiliensis]